MDFNLDWGTGAITEISQYSGTFCLHDACMPLPHFSLLEELMLGFSAPFLPKVALLGPNSTGQSGSELVGYTS